MRCDQVIRELAVPTDGRDTTALARHMASCRSCAQWAERAGQLDRLWSSTRPIEPPVDVWDAVWSRLTASLDRAGVSDHAPIASRLSSSSGASGRQRSAAYRQLDGAPRWGTWKWAAAGIVLAQAAALVLAIWLSNRGRPAPGAARLAANAIAAASVDLSTQPLVSIALPGDGFPVVIDEGHLVVIHQGSQTRQVRVPVLLSGLPLFEIQAEGLAPSVMDRTPAEGAFGVDDCVMFNALESMASPVVAMKE